MPYHVRIKVHGEPHEPVRLDLAHQELEDVIIGPYQSGDPILIGGQSIAPTKIQKVRIAYTADASEKVLSAIRKEPGHGPAGTDTPAEWYVLEWGTDVTAEFITGPPGVRENSRTDRELDDYEQGILRILSGTGKKGASIESMSKTLGLKVGQTVSYLDRLRESGLVKYSVWINRPTRYHLSDEGKRRLPEG